LPGRNAHEAVSDFIHAHQQALDCVTNGVLTRRFKPDLAVNAATMNEGLVPARLYSDQPLSLLFTVHYRHVALGHRRSWAVACAGYNFEVLGRSGSEIVLYHWHPMGRSVVTWPHIHIASGQLQPDSVLSKSHLPSEKLLLPRLVKDVLLGGFLVSPRRKDWPDVLAKGQHQLEADEAAVLAHEQT
jgi:hypothetical protein